jgi:hypothetical protein
LAWGATGATGSIDIVDMKSADKSVAPLIDLTLEQAIRGGCNAGCPHCRVCPTIESVFLAKIDLFHE